MYKPKLKSRRHFRQQLKLRTLRDGFRIDSVNKKLSRLIEYDPLIDKHLQGFFTGKPRLNRNLVRTRLVTSKGYLVPKRRYKPGHRRKQHVGFSAYSLRLMGSTQESFNFSQGRVRKLKDMRRRPGAQSVSFMDISS